MSQAIKPVKVDNITLEKVAGIVQIKSGVIPAIANSVAKSLNTTYTAEADGTIYLIDVTLGNPEITSDGLTPPVTVIQMTNYKEHGNSIHAHIKKGNKYRVNATNGTVRWQPLV